MVCAPFSGKMQRIRFSLNKCSFCVGKSHCASCGAELAELLETLPGVARVHAIMGERVMEIETSLADDELDDAFERWGVFRV